MFKPFNIKQTIAFGFLCLIVVGCSSYTPYRYSFSLIEPQNETLHNDVVGQELSFEDSDVEFRFVPSSENIHMTIKNKTDHPIYLVRDKAEYIDFSGESYRIHYGYDYVLEVTNFAVSNNLFAPSLRIDPNSEVTGYVWINNWPDFHLGQGPGNDPTLDPNILTRMDPFFPRYSFEGSVEDLKNSTFNLILPIDFGEYVRNYTFTFKIDDVILASLDKN
ncbi:MAG: hypothetical protein ACC651_04865 [Candidatus Scalindua sp.]